MKGYLFSLILLICTIEDVIGLAKVSTVEECFECGCLNIIANDFQQVEYIEGYSDSFIKVIIPHIIVLCLSLSLVRS